MSIPYHFDTPVPRYFKDNGYFSISNKLRIKNLLFLTWAFSKCSCYPNKVNHDGKNINLSPFEFICGRMTCSEDTGLTEDEARYQITSFIRLKFLVKTKNSVNNRYSCYRWCVESLPQLKSKLYPTETPTDLHPTIQPEQENEKVIPNSNTNKTPTESPQSRSRPKNIDIDQGSYKKSQKEVKLNGKDFSYLEGLGFSTVIAKQVIDAFNEKPPLVKKNVNGLIKVWASNTLSAYQFAHTLEGQRFGHYEVSACNKHIEFIGTGNCQPIVIIYTEQDALEKIKATASRLAVVN